MESEVAELRERLAEAEELLKAIRKGRIDALVLSDPARDRVYTLEGTDCTCRFLVENMNEGAVILSEDGTILYCNRGFADMVRTSIEKIKGGSILNFIHTADQDRFYGIYRSASERDAAGEIILNTGGGKISVRVSLKQFPVRDAKVFCLIVTDLTVQKKAEERLKAVARQLSRLSSQTTLAEQRERRRLALIIHDHLQQLIVGAKIRLEILNRRLGKDYQYESEQIYNLLVESLKTARSLSTQLAPNILYERGLIPGLEWLAGSMKEAHNLYVEMHADPVVTPEREDVKVLLFESTRELLFNVVKHARTSSARLKVSQNQTGHLRITVSDRGIGFDPGKLMKDVGRDDRFGLFSIQERLELMGGHLEIESSPGRGSAFSLIVPIEESAVAEDRLEEDGTYLEEAASISVSAEKKIRVLLVDDHVVMRQGLGSLLEGHPEIEVVAEAADGEEAVHAARELHPDVILMDISMPRMNGIEATRLIHSEFPYIRIIGLSMYDEAETTRAMLEAGASAYMTKSGHSDVLVEAIRGMNTPPA